MPTVRAVLVGNVHADVAEGQLRQLMGSFGEVEDARLYDQGAGVWEVVYEHERDADDALHVTGTVLKGKAIDVKKRPVDEAPAAGQLVLHGASSGAVTVAPVPMVTSAGQAIVQQAPIAPGVKTEGIPGVGITRDIVEMVQAQPHIANTLIPLLEAHTSQGQTELGLTSMIADFRRQQAQREAEAKANEEKLKMQREIERLKAEILEKKEVQATPPPAVRGAAKDEVHTKSASPRRPRRDDRSSDDGSRRRRRDSRDARRRRRSSSADRGRRAQDRDRRGGARRRRSSSSSSRSSSESSSSSARHRRDRASRTAKKSTTPPPPAAAAPPPPADVDNTYVSPTPTQHLYIVYPRGSGPPPLQAVRKHFDKLGRLTDLKVSKSLGGVFASLEKCPEGVLDTLRGIADFSGASVNYATTAYPVYLKKKAEADKAAAKEKDEVDREAKEKRRKEEKEREEERQRERERQAAERREREREREEAEERKRAEKKKSKWEALRPMGSAAEKKEKDKDATAEKADVKKTADKKDDERDRDRDRRAGRDSGRRDDRDRRRDSRDRDAGRRDRRDSRDRDYDRRDRRDRDRDRDIDRRDRRRDSRDRYRRR